MMPIGIASSLNELLALILISASSLPIAQPAIADLGVCLTDSVVVAPVLRQQGKIRIVDLP